MIKIYTEQDSARLRYIINELFTVMHGLDVEFVDLEQFYNLPEETPKICYSQEHIGNSLHIEPAELLFEEGIEEQEIDVDQWANSYYFFRTGKDHADSLPYDIFSAAFYLITRYEEYLPHTADQHGRFKATDSLAYQNNFLEEPVVDQWMKELLNRMSQLFPNMEKSKRHFRHLKTIDVDNVYAYRHKGPIVNGIHLLSDTMQGKHKQAKQRLKSILRLTPDPFFNLGELADILKPYAEDTCFFFHCGGHGKYDKKVWTPSIKYALIRRKLSKLFAVGLHPSYCAAHHPNLLKIEKGMLELHTGESIKSCRSHYLLFTLPQDYRELEEKGFTDDFTMGYSNNPGFRAGTSLPFHFYDLEQERASGLTIHPLAVMDKTLHSNLGLKPEEAENYILKLGEKVKDVNGEFVTLFHNENQTDAEGFGWEGWNAMYKDLLTKI